jgi:hypothetical protein
VITARELTRRESAGARGIGFAIAGLTLAAVAGVAAANGADWVLIGLPGSAALIALTLWLRARRRPDPTLRNCVAVRGRVVAARKVDDGIALDVRIEPLGREPTQTTTVLSSIPGGREAAVGRTFSGFWNPDRPDHFVEMTFNVTEAENEGGP